LVDRIEHNSSSWSSGQGRSGSSSSTTTEGSSEESSNNNSGNDTTCKTSSEGNINWGSRSKAIDSTSSVEASTYGGLIVSLDFLERSVVTVVDLSVDGNNTIWKSLNSLTFGDVDTETSVGAVIWAFWWSNLGRRNTCKKSVIDRAVSVFVAFSRVKTVGVVDT